MATQLSTDHLEQQISQLPLHEQLRLAAHICARLSVSAQADTLTKEEESLERKNQIETEELLALCEAAAEKWAGEFDSAAELRQLRQGRDEQIWLNR